MSRAISRLFGNKNFWYWLLFINVVACLAGCGLVVTAVSVLFLLLLVAILIISGFFRMLSRQLEEGRRRREEVRSRRETQREWERGAPDRERQRRGQEAFAKQQASANKRRSDARARCELFYNLHGPELKERLSHKQFADYWQRHLGDDNPPDHAEERAAQLLSIMQQHLEKGGHREQKKSLADIAAWFLEEKTKIDALPLNPEDKAQLIVDLEARFTQLQQKYVRSVNP